MEQYNIKKFGNDLSELHRALVVSFLVAVSAASVRTKKHTYLSKEQFLDLGYTYNKDVSIADIQECIQYMEKHECITVSGVRLYITEKGTHIGMAFHCLNLLGLKPDQVNEVSMSVVGHGILGDATSEEDEEVTGTIH